jgi:hypothetical protein
LSTRVGGGLETARTHIIAFIVDQLLVRIHSAEYSIIIADVKVLIGIGILSYKSCGNKP